MTHKILDRVRNIGVIAHIDAGKTTVSERFLYYTGLTHKIGEVHDGEAVMDFRPDERERGITISAASSTLSWRDVQINLVDTPGHVDFTAEVERSLRVLDGAVVVFSGVEGVEPQSETVWHQADRYGVPRLAFINKLDRVGADHERVLEEIRGKLGAHALFVNLPHGLEEKLDGVIDLLTMKWLVFEPDNRGRELEEREIPADAREAAAAARTRLIEGTAEVVDWLGDMYLMEEAISSVDLKRALRDATVAGRLVPVLCGAALKDLGIRPVLDAVCDYLPSPVERPPAEGHDPATGDRMQRIPSPDEPFSALVFKVVAARETDFTWVRVYSGTLDGDQRVYNPRTKVRLRLRNLVRLYADRSEPVKLAEVGDILAAQGLKDVVTGDTLCDPEAPIAFETIHFPPTVVSVAVEARTNAERERLIEVVARLTREDPTFRFHTDAETGQLLLSGMGELHLDVIRNRMQREFNVAARFGRPRVSYRETVGSPGRADGSFDKRIGEAAIHATARVLLEPRPRELGDLSRPPVEIELAGSARMLSPGLQAEAADILRSGLEAGGAYGYPVVDVKATLEAVDLGDAPDPLLPLGASISTALRHALAQAATVVLEPVMKFEVRVPEDFLGVVVKDLGARRAEIRDTGLAGPVALVRGLVPLSAMFGYSTDVRSLTQGRGSFSLEPFDYQAVPEHIAARDHTLL